MAWQEFRCRLAAYHGWIFRYRKAITTCMLVAILIYALLELALNWGNWAELNWMILTGLPVGLTFIWNTNAIRRGFEEMTDGLSSNDLLRFTTPGSDPKACLFVDDSELRGKLRGEAKAKIEEDAALWGFGVCLLFVPLCLYVLNLTTRNDLAETQILLYVIVVPMAFACGLRMGRMACYGWQGLRYQTLEVRDYRVAIAPRLGHPDQTGGLAAIGSFYNHQVGKMAHLILFLLAWLWILTIWRNQPFVTNNYPPETVLGLVALFILIFAIQILGFILPMWKIHQELSAWKERELERIYITSAEIEGGLREHGEDPQEHAKLVLRKIDLRQEREDIAGMILWPVSLKTFHKFWFGKMVSFTIAGAASYGDVTGFLQSIISASEAELIARTAAETVSRAF